MEIIDLQNIPGSHLISKTFKIKYPETYNYIKSKYPELPIANALYIDKYGVGKCKNCGKETKFINCKQGYSSYCCSKCANSDPNKKEKTVQSNIQKYGVKNISQLDSVKKKKEGKCNKGGGHVWSDETREKIKKTMLKKYGVEHASQCEDHKDKLKRTCLKKYGVEHFSQLDYIKDSKRQKIIQKTLQDKSFLADCFSRDGQIVYTCKCPNPKCNKCQEKTYETYPNIYYDRERTGAEQCTKLVPIGGINRNTTIELFVKDVLNDIGINIPEIHENRSILGGKGLDFYIPEYKIAIECNGIYFHSSKNKTISYHYNKYKNCCQQGIQLLTIWEDWVHNKPEIVSSLIKSKFGRFDNRIGASRCKIKQIDSKLAAEFLTNNHIQGNCNPFINYGLYYKNELVSLMCFGKKRTAIMGNSNNKGEWELMRFCNKLNCQIIGGASRLFTHFIKEYNPDIVSTYASHDISNGNLYKKLGFQKEKESYGNYWYIQNNTLIRYHRSKFCKSELKKMGYDISKSESEIMDELPYFKIYDSGMTKWVYKKERS